MAGSGRKARGRDVANRVRDAFDKALDELEQSPGGVIALKEIIVQCMTTDPLKTLDTLAKYVPKEMMIENNTTHTFIQGAPLDMDAWEKDHLSGPAITTEH